MRYRRKVPAKLPGNGGVRVTGVNLLANGSRQFYRGQPMAFLVLGDLRVAINGQVAHDDRHFAQARSNRCAQSLGAKVDSVAAFAIRRMNDERLEDAALLDVRSKFFERGLGELGARVVRILMKQRDGDEQRPAVRNAGVSGGRRDRHLEGRRCIRARGNVCKPILRVCLRLRIEQIELKVFGLVPRHAHEGIVPLRNSGRKSSATLG